MKLSEEHLNIFKQQTEISFKNWEKNSEEKISFPKNCSVPLNLKLVVEVETYVERQR